MLTIDATVGGAAANSYATVDEYAAYWDSRVLSSLNAKPGSFGNEMIAAALVEAARRLDQEQYLGRKVTQTQALKFPRAADGNYLYDFSDDEGYPIDSTTIPQVVKDAQCELAYALLLDPGLFDGDPLSRFSRVVVGDEDLTPRAGAGRYHELPFRVIYLLRYLRIGSQAQIIRA
jgi:hypothetical protein